MKCTVNVKIEAHTTFHQRSCQKGGMVGRRHRCYIPGGYCAAWNSMFKFIWISKNQSQGRYSQIPKSRTERNK